jgi:hypothetical protein
MPPESITSQKMMVIHWMLFDWSHQMWWRSSIEWLLDLSKHQRCAWPDCMSPARGIAWLCQHCASLLFDCGYGWLPPMLWSQWTRASSATAIVTCRTQRRSSDFQRFSNDVTASSQWHGASGELCPRRNSREYESQRMQQNASWDIGIVCTMSWMPFNCGRIRLRSRRFWMPWGKHFKVSRSHAEVRSVCASWVSGDLH